MARHMYGGWRVLRHSCLRRDNDDGDNCPPPKEKQKKFLKHHPKQG